MRAFHGLALALTLALSGPALAVQPDEILDDPVLEERARDLSTGLRCLVCRNESIDESNDGFGARYAHPVARAGWSRAIVDSEVVDFLVAHYVEYVLLRPPPPRAAIPSMACRNRGPFPCRLRRAVFYLRSRARQKQQAMT